MSHPAGDGEFRDRSTTGELPRPVRDAPTAAADPGDPSDDGHAFADADRFAESFEADPLHDRLAILTDRLRPVLDGIARASAALVRPFEFATAAVFAFGTANAMQSPDRRRRDLALALPTALIAAAAIALGVAGAAQRSGLAAEYRAIAAAAADADDFRAIRVYAGREFDLDGSADALFRTAQAYERLGEPDKAADLMRRLADGRDYGPAYLWLADRSLSDPATFRDPESLAAVTRDLRRAEVVGVAVGDSAPRLARALAAAGDIQAALPYLERAAVDDPSLRLELASAYARAGRPDDARKAAAAAEGYFRKQVEARPDDEGLRAKWVTCLLNTRRAGEAIAAIEGRPNGELLADIYVVALLERDRELVGAAGSANERLRLVERALAVRPRSEEALLRLVELADDPGTAEVAAAAGQSLGRILAGGDVPASVYLARGVKAWQRGDEAAALAFLEKAHAADPDEPVAANNVAWLLARGGDAGLERALAIADDLVAKHPDAAQFRDTRGQVLARLGRWNEALVELERALPGMKDSPETRRALAAAYRKAGRGNLADLHDREADELEATSQRREDEPPRRTEPN